MAAAGAAGGGCCCAGLRCIWLGDRPGLWRSADVNERGPPAGASRSQSQARAATFKAAFSVVVVAPGGGGAAAAEPSAAGTSAAGPAARASRGGAGGRPQAEAPGGGAVARAEPAAGGNALRAAAPRQAPSPGAPLLAPANGAVDGCAVNPQSNPGIRKDDPIRRGPEAFITVPAEQRSEPHFLDGYARAFRAALTEDGSISTDGWTQACRTLLPLYDRLFNSVLASMLKKDLESDVVSVEKSRAAALAAKDTPEFDGNDANTLELLLTREEKLMGAKRGKDKKSGSFGLLWTQRSASMISKLLLFLATREDMDSCQCCQKAYEETIKKYHGWVVGKATRLAMSQAPDKMTILSKLDIVEDRGPAVKAVEALDACLAGLQDAVMATGSNFEDKL